MYQVYKFLRMVNATYPNNGFMGRVRTNENQEVEEDLLDIVNEALNEADKSLLLDEMYSFPTVKGQQEYMLPTGCVFANIEEVTREGGNYLPHTHPVKEIEKIVEGDNWEEKYYQGYGLPMRDNNDVHYYGRVHHHGNHGRSTRMVFARTAEELTGNRYYNAWGEDRIGIYPAPTTDGEIITIFYKRKPKAVTSKDDDIEIKDKWINILKYSVCSKLAMAGSNPDVNLYNIYAREFNDLLLQARREKGADEPFYPHAKDNERPMNWFRRRRFGRRV